MDPHKDMSVTRAVFEYFLMMIQIWLETRTATKMKVM
jgi:hypothetical protein